MGGISTGNLESEDGHRRILRLHGGDHPGTGHPGQPLVHVNKILWIDCTVIGAAEPCYFELSLD